MTQPTGRPRKLNKYQFDGDIVIGLTTNTGKEFLVDLCDLEKIKDFTWYENHEGYIETGLQKGAKRERVFLHRLLMGVHGQDWKKMQIDHINNDRKDNRKSNLRICDCGDNQLNKTKPRKDNTSGHTGVYREKRWGGAWMARISYRGKHISLGYFKNKDDAIKARAEAELFYYKDFCNLNPAIGWEG
ncbi:MAG: HNH endonuclease [Proteobacteria bacterium]|nr:HNH endonuclease [Pseudomonadota bacterium]